MIAGSGAPTAFDGERGRTVINVSDGLASLLRTLQLSLAFTSYQSGHLFLAGVDAEGRIAIDQQRFERAMGLHWDGTRLLLATATQVIVFRNMLLPGETGDGRHDAVLVPRIAWTTNDVDAHEIAADAQGRPLFVATKFNCIATVDPAFSFAPVWMPGFVGGSDKGDRCHLNGMALDRGRLAYASAVAETDKIDGWRAHRDNGGVIVDCRSGRTVCRGLSMPHSPRLEGDKLWFLEAGTGALGCFDLGTGSRRDVAFCPGFARGLQILDTHVVVTVSKPRDARFEGLRLDAHLAEQGLEPWCGVIIINKETGVIEGWIRLQGPVQEMFDVAVLPGIACPRALAPGTREIWDNVRPRPPR